MRRARRLPRRWDSRAGMTTAEQLLALQLLPDPVDSAQRRDLPLDVHRPSRHDLRLLSGSGSLGS